MAVAADEFFGRPTEELAVAGVTGTAGKTTTAFLLYAVLAAAGRRPGLLGTIETRVDGERRPATRTTAEAIDLQRLFREMLDAGDRSCAMEATSHGSALRRLDRVRFSVARLHQPRPGPPRLPPRHGGLLRREAAAVPRRARAACGRQRRRPIRPPARRRAARARGRRCSPTAWPTTPRSAPDDRRTVRTSCASRGRFNLENVARRRSPRRGCSGSTTRRSRAGSPRSPASPAGSSRWTRARTSR